MVSTHGRARRLERLLASLRAQTLPRDAFELVVVDNCSDDDTPDVLAGAMARNDLPLTVVRHDVPGGPATGRDAGWRRCSAPLVAFADDDVIVHPDWLEQLVAAAFRHPGCILQGRTDPDPAEAGDLGPFARSISVTSLGPFYETCNIAYPRAVLERVDGFNTTYTYGGEDTDLAWRAMATGVQAQFVPEARAWHAVHVLGPGGALRHAQRWGDVPRLFRDHPALRREALTWGMFHRPSHFLLTAAAAGALCSRRLPAAALLAYPYLRHLEGRWGRSPELAPYLVVNDLVEMVTILRGAIRHRVPMA